MSVVEDDFDADLYSSGDFTGFTNSQLLAMHEDLIRIATGGGGGEMDSGGGSGSGSGSGMKMLLEVEDKEEGDVFKTMCPEQLAWVQERVTAEMMKRQDTKKEAEDAEEEEVKKKEEEKGDEDEEDEAEEDKDDQDEDEDEEERVEMVEVQQGKQSIELLNTFEQLYIVFFDSNVFIPQVSL